MSFIKKDALCYDIGANVGTVSRQLFEAGAGNIIAVEPCWQNFLLLRQVPKVTAIHAACWSEPAIIEVSFSQSEPGWSSVKPDKWQTAYPAEWAPPEHIPAITLDQLIRKYGLPQYVKIDVEGAEFEVLSGLTQRPEILSFEFHDNFKEDIFNCIELCRLLGFKRAHYTTENLNIDTLPIIKIGEFWDRFCLEAPKWGMVTVI